jgi:hypothetical protein
MDKLFCTHRSCVLSLQSTVYWTIYAFRCLYFGESKYRKFVLTVLYSLVQCSQMLFSIGRHWIAQCVAFYHKKVFLLSRWSYTIVNITLYKIKIFYHDCVSNCSILIMPSCCLLLIVSWCLNTAMWCCSMWLFNVDCNVISYVSSFKLMSISCKSRIVKYEMLFLFYYVLPFLIEHPCSS